MNRILEAYARQWLKDHLRSCTEEQQTLFKRIYQNDRIKRGDFLPINQVVDEMPLHKLDWAMVQVLNTEKING